MQGMLREKEDTRNLNLLNKLLRYNKEVEVGNAENVAGERRRSLCKLCGLDKCTNSHVFGVMVGGGCGWGRRGVGGVMTYVGEAS